MPAATGAVRAMAPLHFPTETVKASGLLPDLDRYKGPPLEYGRMEPTASDPAVQQQFGMIVGVPECRPGERTRNPQHPRRALGHLSRRLRPPPRRRPAAARRTRRVRDIAPDAGCARACGRTRRRLRAQSRPRADADVRGGVLVQGLLRHQGHALHRRWRRALRHRFSGARSRAGRAAAQQGRDHLRQGRQYRIQRPCRGSRAAAIGPRRYCPRRSAISAAPGAAIPPIPTTPRARLRSVRARGRPYRSASIW